MCTRQHFLTRILLSLVTSVLFLGVSAGGRGGDEVRCSVTYVVTRNHYQETIKRKKRIEGNKNKKRKEEEEKTKTHNSNNERERERERSPEAPRNLVITNSQ